MSAKSASLSCDIPNSFRLCLNFSPNLVAKSFISHLVKEKDYPKLRTIKPRIIIRIYVLGLVYLTLFELKLTNLENEMPKTSAKFYKEFYSTLQDENIDSFTLIELRDAYLLMSKSQQSASAAYNFVYRQVRKLENSGLLVKDKKVKGKNKYRKIEGFIHSDFYLAHFKGSKKYNIELSTSQLNERLKKSEIDLLVSIGESEEYKRLSIALPDMQDYLESQYILAQEKNSKLLGQIKAIKYVIAHKKSKSIEV